MTVPAFSLVAPRPTFDARSLIERLPNPSYAGQTEYWAMYEVLHAQAARLDGEDREGAFDHLMSVCSVFVDFAADIGRSLEQWQLEPDPSPEEEDEDDDFGRNDEGDEQDVVPQLSDFELEDRGQLLLPFVGVAEHYAAIERGVTHRNSRRGGPTAAPTEGVSPASR